jgi:hypothetical protein
VVEHLTPAGDGTIYPIFCIATEFLHKQSETPSVVQTSCLTFSEPFIFVLGQEVMPGSDDRKQALTCES